MDKAFTRLGIPGAINERDAGRDDGGHAGIDKFDGETRIFGGQTEEINHQSDTELPTRNAIRDAEGAFGDRRTITRDAQHLVPAFGPAFPLEDGFHCEVGGARAGRG